MLLGDNSEHELRFIMNLEDKILDRINQQLDQGRNLSELYVTVTSSFQMIYGPNSAQLRLVETVREQVYNRPERGRTATNDWDFKEELYGCLRGLKAEIEGGLIVNIQTQARGEVFGDFLVLAREALDEEQKDVAAVLACAALEDALKRYARYQGLDVGDKDMSEVVNALKSKGVIRGPQGALLSGFVKIRNKTFHAQWAAIDTADVKSIIGFTEEFLVTRFSSPIHANSQANP